MAAAGGRKFRLIHINKTLRKIKGPVTGPIMKGNVSTPGFPCTAALSQPRLLILLKKCGFPAWLRVGFQRGALLVFRFEACSVLGSCFCPDRAAGTGPASLTSPMSPGNGRNPHPATHTASGGSKRSNEHTHPLTVCGNYSANCVLCHRTINN